VPKVLTKERLQFAGKRKEPFDEKKDEVRNGEDEEDIVGESLYYPTMKNGMKETL